MRKNLTGIGDWGIKGIRRYERRGRILQDGSLRR
jgi:hypothetical protein